MIARIRDQVRNKRTGFIAADLASRVIRARVLIRGERLGPRLVNTGPSLAGLVRSGL